MKTIKSIKLTVLLVVLSSPFALAQNFDANRMNRDINIMENILNEMFKTQSIVNRSGNSVAISGAVTISGFGNSNVRGTYMPGYGVIFMVSNRSVWAPGTSVSVDSESGYTFYYSTNDDNDSDDTKVNQESITNRITEFLKDYASTIGQLKSNENVIVIYGNQTNSLRGLTYAISGRVDRGTERERLPVISVSAKKSDLDAFRSGRLNEDAFDNRVAVATSEDREYLDLKVMSNIFETALRSSDKEAFGLYGNISYLMLDNFGAIFNMDAGYRRSGSNSFFEVRGITTSGAYIRSDARSEEELKQEQEEYLQKVQAAFTELKQNLKEYLVDYGRTLSSVKSDQYILVTVDINGRYEGIPNRVDVQVKRSVLEQLDRGSITRDAALNQVGVTEY